MGFHFLCRSLVCQFLPTLQKRLEAANAKLMAENAELRGYVDTLTEKLGL